ncbi:hypothetical protein Y032_0104g3595 [Ancylostoma ceylanicum]|uniref:Uncharacterized protein n=1 Tax=Ancylostoma ceylanicum TaxID=53326 RepID=A0A016TGP3_9BILA|nr:hypothetical protein Y032_0104g3595 [Ancylostoma ceylanicum]
MEVSEGRESNVINYENLLVNDPFVVPLDNISSFPRNPQFSEEVDAVVTSKKLHHILEVHIDLGYTNGSQTASTFRESLLRLHQPLIGERISSYAKIAGNP